MLKKSMFALVAVIFALQGCAGKTPNPVAKYTPADKYMDCDAIAMEISDNQNKIRKMFPKTNKTGKNVGLGVAGAFLLVPWFFMDFSDAERVEIDAMQRRNEWLRVLAGKKQCDASCFPKKIKFQTQKKGKKNNRQTKNVTASVN